MLPHTQLQRGLSRWPRPQVQPFAFAFLDRNEIEMRIAQREQWVSDCRTQWSKLRELLHRESARELAERVASRARRLEAELRVLYWRMSRLPWP
jgi:hypothetical protein